MIPYSYSTYYNFVIGAYWKFQTNMLFHFQRKPGAFAHGTHGRARKFFSIVAKQRIFREIQCIAPAQLNLFHSTGVDSLFCPEGASFSAQGRGKSLDTWSGLKDISARLVPGFLQFKRTRSRLVLLSNKSFQLQFIDL